MEDCLLSRLEMHFELHFRCRDSFGGRIALNASLTNCVVQTFIREQHEVLLNLVFQSLPFLLPVHTTHFEDVGEVGAKCHAEWQQQGGKAVINKCKLLIANIVPQEFGSLQVERSPRYGNSIEVGDIEIGEVGGEEKVVCLNGGTKRQWASAP
jgi:hypothetical protein